MSPFIEFNCGCIEGPMPSVKCWQHDAPIKVVIPAKAGIQKKEGRGVAQYIDCPMGRPIQVWITNGRCSGAQICPQRYICPHKPAQGKLL